jgi:hypothetical protein
MSGADGGSFLFAIRRTDDPWAEFAVDLSQQEAGAKTADICRKYGISNATSYKWKGYGGLDVSDAKRLKALEHWE